MRTLTPLDNALQDTRSPQDKFLSKVAKKINEVPDLNASNVVSQKLELFNESSVPLGLEAGFANYSAGFIPTFQDYLQNPIKYKINNINAITLGTSITLGGSPIGFSTIADTNYSVDMYLSSYLYENQTKQPINFDGSFRQPAKLLSAKTVFTHTKNGAVADVSYTISRPFIDFNFTDYINGRGLIGSNTDFTVTPEKITQAQYNLLRDTDTFLYTFFGYDFASYSLLTGNNKIHFEQLISGYISGGIFIAPFLTPKVEGYLNYFGLQASYEPINP